ncbi:hypothetical protein CTA1_3143 [Colletotrichum tanaceti]|uniref:Uncharacterized protein n=1 Tax=Colletotrichum tanaceti TaxID=1306861 RepID=A0A4U6XVK9_9PEZI|nr:hypothetical protein CTA1_3143 [Colletotrichum tanaceti]
MESSGPPAQPSVSLMTDKSIQCLDHFIAHGSDLNKLPFSPTTRSALELMGSSSPVTAEVWGTLPRNLQQRIIEIKRCRPQLFDRSPSVSVVTGREGSVVSSPWPSDISRVSLWPSDPGRLPFHALQKRQERTWAEMSNAPDDLAAYPALVAAPALPPASTSAPTHAYVANPTPPGPLAKTPIQQGLPLFSLGDGRGQVAAPERSQKPAPSGYVYPFQDSPAIASPARYENMPEVSYQIQSPRRAAPAAGSSNLRYDKPYNPWEQEHTTNKTENEMKFLDRLAKLRQSHELAVSRWKQHMNALVDEEVTMANLEQQAVELTVSLSAERARGEEADDAWRGKLLREQNLGRVDPALHHAALPPMYRPPSFVVNKSSNQIYPFSSKFVPSSILAIIAEPLADRYTSDTRPSDSDSSDHSHFSPSEISDIFAQNDNMSSSSVIRTPSGQFAKKSGSSQQVRQQKPGEKKDKTTATL